MVLLASFSILLCVLYFAVVLLSCIQLVRIVWNRHMLFGWQGLFLIFVFVWGLVRGFFFLFIDELAELRDTHSWVVYFLYWLPINIQFATFSLLILFYANIIYKCTDSAWWDKYRIIFIGVYLCINLTILCFILTAVVLTSALSNADDVTFFGNSWQNVVTALASACIFSILVSVLGYYGMKIAPLLRDGHVKIPFQPKRTSNVPILFVTFMVFVIFVSRAIFNALSAFGVISLPIDSGSSWMDFAVFVVFMWWDILPTLMVIMLFWRIPSASSTRVPLLPGGAYAINAPGDESVYHQPEPSTLFDNPMRYDSPPEVGGLSSVLLRHSHLLLDPHFAVADSPYSPYNTESPHSCPSASPSPSSNAPSQNGGVAAHWKKKKKPQSKLHISKGSLDDDDEDD